MTVLAALVGGQQVGRPGVRTAPSLSGGDLGAVPAAVASDESVPLGGAPRAGLVDGHGGVVLQRGSDDPPGLLHPVGTGEQALDEIDRAAVQRFAGLLDLH